MIPMSWSIGLSYRIEVKEGVAIVDDHGMYGSPSWETKVPTGYYTIKYGDYNPILETYVTLQHELVAAIENHNQALAETAGV